MVKRDSNTVEVVSDENKSLRVLVYSNPFKVEFYTDNQLVVAFNSKHLLKFEHLRTKP